LGRKVALRVGERSQTGKAPFKALNLRTGEGSQGNLCLENGGEKVKGKREAFGRRTMGTVHSAD